ncbi:Protein kinase-like domain protein [Cordyceps fumosorosea ARSEF 2679]|uniref:Protein kinase-like domain protein n=1 Tax=Cordyceps fumosorosea (strain ARSEF 2679) TaxID=1081104 RepID=A0A167A411_CORFA|nr:Protein kinase-like domain protein [Cordyceps fumosorosea ARSEF 2679]OAA38530.1 Protein kinase-like domain protein [Cordyceps fumosorosea ARSEF 2679]
MAQTVTKEEIENAPRLSTFSPVYKINPTTVVKTGRIVRMAEAETMKFVLDNTSIPVPKVHNAYVDEMTGHVVIIMDFVEGQSLDEAWVAYTEDERRSVIAQLQDHMSQLRSFKGSFIGCIDGTPCQDQYFYSEKENYGPYQTEQEFNQGIIDVMRKQGPYTFTEWRCDVWEDVMKNHEIVLTHNDFDPRNILVRGAKVVAILDWEFSGFYPEYWEYCKAVSCPDWEHPWSRSRAIDQILKPYYKEIAVFWSSGDVIH